MKRRQHDPPRVAMEVAVDRQQPVAHQADQVAKVRLAPAEVGRVRDGDVVVGLRPQHEHHVAVEQPQREDRAEALVGLEQQRQGLGGKAPGARQRRALFAGRKRHGRAALRAQVFEQDRKGARSEQRPRTDEGHEQSLADRLAGRPVWGGEGARDAHTRDRARQVAGAWHTGGMRKVPGRSDATAGA